MSNQDDLSCPQETRRESPPWLRALGSRELPSEIVINERKLSHISTFKHDFFAATAAYGEHTPRFVLKIGRETRLFGLPSRWIGLFLTRREMRMLGRVQGVAGIPRLTGIWRETGLVREFIPGRPLPKGRLPNDSFFPRLAAILDEIHARDMAYVDLEKRENILLGEDGRPYLIDFQISWHLPRNRGGDTWIARKILGVLQSADRYHLLKHWRRARPDQLDAGKLAESRRAPFWIAWHRMLFRPLTVARRWILVRLGARTSIKGRSPG